MALAGLWEQWLRPEGEVLESCSIIVTEANDFMKPIHDRMPVILAQADWNIWLTPTMKDVQILQELLKPYTGDDLSAWPVSTSVTDGLDTRINISIELGECVHLRSRYF